MNIDTIKGFKDFVGEEGTKFSVIREMARQVFERYNFEEVQTPVIEREEFVRGDKVQANDEVISDIFTLQDKGKRKLALRYEFTFQLKRIAQNKKLPYKRFQIGPVFRDEPISGNRLRQFTQCDVDVIGSTIKEEAEILSIMKQILGTLKIKSVIYVNNRKLLNEILNEVGVENNPEVIGEIDKMDKLSEKEIKENLKKFGAEEVFGILKKPESYFKKYKAYSEVAELKKLCKNYGFEIKFSPSLARGLSYYIGNVFEIKSDIKETICGGGSYMVAGQPATGISFSIERMMAVTKMQIEIEKYLIVSLGEDKKAIDLAKKLRIQGKNVSVFYGKPSKALEYANSYKIKKVIFVGEKEVKEKVFRIKNMITGRSVKLVLKKS
ncbi:histidine--tRNA ligase [archaeon]|jgi:histidyl-tRNA synthetase|nr:histidine--tRNA ligase [archaeon]MBT4373483.1 histidine--tRNA ligase [archaeon]MBT4531931.1 histidine--tRNA ligase [archaeon]MBT7001598.1 histidine--tRNA ligase [archaeon]MBT7282510.1 histidine--tRNA ligase [archaeon]